MRLVSKLNSFFNPLVRIGIQKYSLAFPIVANSLVVILSEYFVYQVLQNPMAVGTYIIFVNVFLILYFAFRDGIVGGLISTVAAISYYLYIIYTRNYTGDQLVTSLEVTLMLGLSYALMAAVIGWLKQNLDKIIGKETEARQEAEDGQARLRTILAQLPIGVAIANSQGKLVHVNAALEDMAGYREPGLGKTPKEFSTQSISRNGKVIKSEELPISRAILKGEIVKDEEIEYIKRNGKVTYLKVSAAPIKSGKKLIAAVSTFVDITSAKELEKRKDDFISLASHELKTPITSIKLYTEILLKILKRNKDKESIQVMKHLIEQTDNIQELVSDLLDVSRIQTGKLKFQKDIFFINDLVKEVVMSLQDTTQIHEIIIKKSKSIQVIADKFRIHQVLANLLTNAIKYSPDGGKIIINIQVQKNKVVVSVKDSGLGILKSEQSKIFERLYQVNDSTEKTFPGLGMGLFISKEIIKRHKGNIWVESEKDKGSEFFFSLPI